MIIQVRVGSFMVLMSCVIISREQVCLFVCVQCIILEVSGDVVKTYYSKKMLRWLLELALMVNNI